MANSPWSIIINQKRCNKNAWTQWQSFLDKNKIAYTLHFTNSISELSFVIAELLAIDQRYFLFAGGDGTVHHGGNLLLHHAGHRSHEIVMSVLPCGTGNDWVRSFGVRRNKLAESLRAQKAVPMNILQLQWPDGTKRYAMNMVGGAIDAAVVESLNMQDFPGLGFLKYPFALVKALRKQHKWNATIIVDGKSLSADWLTFEAGFGKYCGGGMYVLPHAKENSPALFLMRTKPFFQTLAILPKVYNGKIGQQQGAITMHWSKIEILHSEIPMPLEADGEWLGYAPVTISPAYGVINRLVKE